ncbi:MAG: hypothetical protein KDA51_17150 [Planctomycetales bacterium]|nr:hypothetical protein [Planctomycetales bacterium]
MCVTFAPSSLIAPPISRSYVTNRSAMVVAGQSLITPATRPMMARFPLGLHHTLEIDVIEMLVAKAMDRRSGPWLTKNMDRRSGPRLTKNMDRRSGPRL